jgi:hypothetical protein
MDTTRISRKGKVGRLRKSIGQQEVCFNGFLDAEYSVILGYGFLQLAQLFDSIRKSLKIADILNPKAWSSVGEATILNGDFVWSLVTSLFLIVMFVMLVDDYYRARMICKNIPIKSVIPFSLDIAIGFLFGLCFMFIMGKSSLYWAALGCVYLFGALWARRIAHESITYITGCVGNCTPLAPDDQAVIDIHRMRLAFIVKSHVAFGLFLILVNCLILLLDYDKKHYWWHFILFVSAYITMEIWYYKAEDKIISEAKKKAGDIDIPIMRTVGWFPQLIFDALAGGSQKVDSNSPISKKAGSNA